MTALDQCRSCQSWPSVTGDGLCETCAVEADRPSVDEIRALLDQLVADGLVERTADGRYAATAAGETYVRSLADTPGAHP